MTWTFEAVSGGPFGAETDGPVWTAGGLLFSDVRGNRILRYDPVSGNVAVVRHSTVRNRGLSIAPDGRLFGAQSRARRIVWYHDDGGTYYLNALVDGQRHNDSQDLVVDRAGRIWFTDLWTDESIGGPVGYPRLEHDSVLVLERTGDDGTVAGTWSVRRATTDTVAPRGIALAPDQGTLYVSDAGTSAEMPSVIRAYRIGHDGSLSDGTVVRAMEPGLRAAGLTITDDGRLVVAVGGGESGAGEIVVIAPDGELLASEALPSGDPTNVGFGGADRATLYVTTSTGDLLIVRDSGLRGVEL